MFDALVSNLSERELVREFNEDFRSKVWPVTTWFGLEILAGTIGNVLTMYVFLLHYQPCNFRLFVLSLAWTDFISCLTTIPAEMVSQMFWFDYHFPAVCKTKVFFNQYTVCAEAASLTIIAIDRHRKVCQPLKWQISNRASLYACIVIHIVSALLAIPTPIFWGVTTKEAVYRGVNLTLSLCEKDAKYERTHYPLVNTSVNGCIVSVSLLIMFVLYVLVLRRLFRARKESIGSKFTDPADEGNVSNAELSSLGPSSDVTSQKVSVQSETALVSPKDEKSEKSKPHAAREGSVTPSACKRRIAIRRARRKTMIGFYLTVIFIVTTVLFWTLISVVATGILDRLEGRSKAVYFFFLRLYFINHVINPILYGILDPQFRKAMKDLKLKLCGCSCSSPEPVQHINTIFRK